MGAPCSILVLGPSARAGAFSAARAGYAPRAGDFFADRDLTALCPTRRIDSGTLAQHAHALAGGRSVPWFYTGGFENRPAQVAEIEHTHRLWGVSAGDLPRTRDPYLIADVLTRADLPHPRVSPSQAGLPRDGSWLVKPRGSSGGRGIIALESHTAVGSDCYYQERIAGRSGSAIYVAAGGRACLLGVSRQVIGYPSMPFGYRGSVGPATISGRLRARLIALGSALARGLPLAGWFGVDFILAHGIPWPVEINPRYTASIEIHELATGRAFLPLHRAACEQGLLPDAPASATPPPPRVIAKRVVYATRPCVAPAIAEAEYQSPRDEIPTIADVPCEGTSFERGDPILTVFAQAPTITEASAKALALERAWRHRLSASRRHT